MLVRRALGDPDDDKFFKDALEFFLAYYREHKLDHTFVYPGIIEALRAMQSGNGAGARRMAVLTNKPVNPPRRRSRLPDSAPSVRELLSAATTRCRPDDTEPHQDTSESRLAF